MLTGHGRRRGTSAKALGTWSAVNRDLDDCRSSKEPAKRPDFASYRRRNVDAGVLSERDFF